MSGDMQLSGHELLMLYKSDAHRIVNTMCWQQGVLVLLCAFFAAFSHSGIAHCTDDLFFGDASIVLYVQV